MAIMKKDAWYRAFVEGAVHEAIGEEAACIAADGRMWSQAELISLARAGHEAWNDWHDKLPDFRWHRTKGKSGWVPGFVCTIQKADLRRISFDGLDLTGIDFVRCNFTRSTFQGTFIGRPRKYPTVDATRFFRCSLRGALFRCNFGRATFEACDFRSAELNSVSAVGADFSRSRFANAILAGSFSDVVLVSTDFSESHWLGVEFVDTDLSVADGLLNATIHTPTVLDHRTLWRSGPLPQEFYRRCGFPENFVDYLPSMIQRAINLNSCFISYSAQDDVIARRLYLDLQKYNVRVFFAPKDLKIGAKIRDGLESAIHARDKLLLILSRHSIASQWVEYEVEAALDREKSEGESVLFPITIDDEVFRAKKSWAATLRRQRHIGDFRGYADARLYNEGLRKLLSDLAIET